MLATLLAMTLATRSCANVAGGQPAAPLPLSPTFRHYGVIDGLPSDSAYTVVQDHGGYIWIGTRDGLARFDATDFQVYRHDPFQPASLPANDVSAVLVDALGRVWAGGEGTGLNLYLPEKQAFKHWMHDPHDRRSLPGNDVLSIAQDIGGSLWVGVYAGGLNRMSANGRGFSHVRHRRNDTAGLLSDNVSALAAAADGGLWVGTDAGLQYRDRRGHLTRIALSADGSPVSVWQLAAYGDGVDAATDAGFFHVDAKRRAWRTGAGEVAYASTRDVDGAVWIARHDGIDLIDAGGRVRHYAPHAGVEGSLPGANALGLLRDRDGGMWFALLDGGIAYLPPQWRAFDAWRHIPDDPGSIADDRVRTLSVAGDGTLWIGAADGVVDALDPRGGGVRHLGVEAGLQKSFVDALAVDARGRIWIGHRYGLRIDDHGRVRDVDIGAGKTRRAVHLLLAASDSMIYFAGAADGVSRIDPASFAVTILRGPAPGSAARQIQQLHEDSAGTVWSASLAGIARLARGTDAFRFVPGIERGAVNAFALGADGSLWIARSDSLQHYALDAGRARLLATIDATHGWPAVTVGALETGDDGRVWAITPRGLVGYDPTTRRVRLCGAAEGLGNPEFVARTLLRATDGTLYAGSLGGIIAIRPADLDAKQSPPQTAPVVLRVRRDGRITDLDPRKPVTLRWDDRELSATAHALSYMDPKHHRYRFMLAGFDSGWVDTGTRDTREFSSLRAGDYRLLVGAAVGDGPWSASRVPIAIHVAEPPWATPLAWTAYVISALLLLVFAAWAMRLRLEQRHRFALLAQRQQLAEQANAAKTRFLAGMAHEIRTPMTGVLGMTELLLGTHLDQRQRSFADGIRRSGVLLMRQVNDALDLARIEAGKLELIDAPFDPAALLREAAALERGLAERKGLKLDVLIDANVPRALRGDALRIQQVLLNLVHNALKFTHAGGVRLQLQREDGGTAFAVSDDGPGLTEEECARLFNRFEQTEYGKRHSGSGLGLAISRELVALMNGRIDVRSQPGRGCTFRLVLPLPECEMVSDHVAHHDMASIGENASGKGGQPLRILLVDDDPVAAQVIAGLLQAHNHIASHAPNALAALTELESSREGFDAILMDLDLPGMDGCALARMLRARGLRVPIVAITAGSVGDEEQRARDAGVDAFLRKPIPPESLRKVLEAMQPVAVGGS